MLKKLLLLCAGIAVLIGGPVGCASSKDPNEVTSEPVSTLPWNRPQNWEGKGVLGGMTGGN